MCNISDSELQLYFVFLNEAKTKSNMALACINSFNSANPKDTGALRFWLHSFLHHSAAVSMIFWPSRKQSKTRGERLRNAVGIAECMDFLKKRTLRDHITHMDERLESWHKDSNDHNMCSFVVGERNAIQGLATEDIFEQFIPSEKVFVFRGEEFDIQRTVDCLEMLHGAVAPIVAIPHLHPDFRQHFELNCG